MTAIEFAEKRLLDHLRYEIRESLPRHQWDMAERPDLLAEIVDQYNQALYPDAVAIMELRKFLKD